MFFLCHFTVALRGGMKKDRKRYVVSKLKQWSKLHICCSRNIPYIFTHMTPKLPHDTQEHRVQQLLFCDVGYNYEFRYLFYYKKLNVFVLHVYKEF